jgi:hypothetical protein
MQFYSQNKNKNKLSKQFESGEIDMFINFTQIQEENV